MPIEKIPFESELYFEIQAKYEGKIGTVQELANEYGIAREYLTRYAKKHKWVRGKEQEYYNAKKFTKEKETLAKYAEDEQEEKIIAKVGEIAERKAREISEIKISKKLEEEKAQEYALRIRSLLLEDMIKVLENGNSSDGIMESFEYNQQGKMETKKTVSKASKYKILNDVKYIDLLKGLGLLQTQPTVAIQNNNTNNQSEEGKTKTTKEPLIIFEPHYAENKD